MHLKGSLCRLLVFKILAMSKTFLINFILAMSGICGLGHVSEVQVYSSQAKPVNLPLDATFHHTGSEKSSIEKQFVATSSLLDAALNSLNSLTSLIKKENYRNKISSFNNPTSSELGFSLEVEIQSALRPILAKTKNTNTYKFSEVVSSIIGNPVRSQLPKTTMGARMVFNTLLSLVGTLTIQEKKVTPQDLDSFMYATSRYFVQYEKLNQANQSFDESIEKLNIKVQELQFDIKEYMLDMISILHNEVSRTQLKQKSLEELLLKYLDKEVLDTIFKDKYDTYNTVEKYYPGDGIKTAKEISYTTQKLFNEYQKLYADNYGEIRNILMQSKGLGKNIDTKQVDRSIRELEELYTDSKNADVLNIRLTTLFERLKNLVNTEQLKD